VNEVAQSRLRSGRRRGALVDAAVRHRRWWGASPTGARSCEPGNSRTFLQEYFEPAVMMACGKGSSSRRDVEAVENFFLRRTDRFSCEQIPVSIAVDRPGFGQAGMRI